MREFARRRGARRATNSGMIWVGRHGIHSPCCQVQFNELIPFSGSDTHPNDAMTTCNSHGVERVVDERSEWKWASWTRWTEHERRMGRVVSTNIWVVHPPSVGDG